MLYAEALVKGQVAMQSGQLKRREFITLVGAAAASRPLVARARTAGKLPTIGLLLSRARVQRTAHGSPDWYRDCTNSVGSRIAQSRFAAIVRFSDRRRGAANDASTHHLNGERLSGRIGDQMQVKIAEAAVPQGRVD